MKQVIFGLAAALGLATSAQAASPVAVDVHVGSTGLGAEAQYFFNDYFAGRVSADWLHVSHSFDSDDIRFSGGANWATVGVFGDLHPFKNGWLVSAGVFDGDRKARLAGAPMNDMSIGGMTLTPAQIGKVGGQAKLNSASPFLGLGWDSAQHAHSGLTFRALAGAAFGGPRVSLGDQGPYGAQPAVQAWAASETTSVEDKIRMLHAYPVLQLGLGYRF